MERSIMDLHNKSIEQAVVGILIHYGEVNDETADIIDHVKKTDFAFNDYAYIYDVICDQARLNNKFDLINIDNTLSDCWPDYENRGGFALVAELADHSSSRANLKSYADRLVKVAKARQFSERLNGAQEIMAGHHDHLAAISECQTLLSDFDYDTQKGGVEHIQHTLDDFLQGVEDALLNNGNIGKQTGIKGLDSILGGLSPGDLVIVAGKPGSGKTTLALNIARHMSMQGDNVLGFSLEMPKRQINQKLCSDIANVPLNSIRDGSAASDDAAFSRMSLYINTMKQSNFYLDDTGGLHINQLLSRARKHKMKNGKPDMIWVDYIQIVKADGDQRYLQVSNVSMALKALAKEMDCPVIALSQLKKETNGRPKKEHLRESGQIEQDADVILFVHTDNDDNVPMENQLTEAIVAKQRMGQSGTACLKNKLSVQRFECAGTSVVPDYDDKRNKSNEVFK